MPGALAKYQWSHMTMVERAAHGDRQGQKWYNERLIQQRHHRVGFRSAELRRTIERGCLDDYDSGHDLGVTHKANVPRMTFVVANQRVGAVEKVPVHEWGELVKADGVWANLVARGVHGARDLVKVARNDRDIIRISHGVSLPAHAGGESDSAATIQVGSGLAATKPAFFQASAMHAQATRAVCLAAAASRRTCGELGRKPGYPR